MHDIKLDVGDLILFSFYWWKSDVAGGVCPLQVILMQG